MEVIELLWQLAMEEELLDWCLESAVTSAQLLLWLGVLSPPGDKGEFRQLLVGGSCVLWTGALVVALIGHFLESRDFSVCLLWGMCRLVPVFLPRWALLWHAAVGAQEGILSKRRIRCPGFRCVLDSTYWWTHQTRGTGSSWEVHREVGHQCICFTLHSSHLAELGELASP